MFNKDKINTLTKENEELRKELSNKTYFDKIDSLKAQIAQLSATRDELSIKVNSLYNEDIKDISEIQYMYKYPSEYKQKIDSIRLFQKRMDNVIKLNHKNSRITNKLYGDMAKMMQCIFDIQCDNIMNHVTYSSKTNLENTIHRLAKRIERQFREISFSFNEKYIDLKVNEVYTVFEYKCKIKADKEQKEHERDILKDQAKADKEIERRIKTNNASLINLKYQFNKLKEANKDTSEVELSINDIEDKIGKDNILLKYKKSGYVYVVGNRDMKDNLVKVGITRRSNIDDRMKELSGASHSFPMEVYGYIFSDDCYKTEAKIHEYLKDKRLNVLKEHREWFITTLEDIKTAFKESCDIDIELSKNPCEDYLESAKKFVDFYGNNDII